MENVLRLQSDGIDARAASHGGTVTRVDGTYLAREHLTMELDRRSRWRG